MTKSSKRQLSRYDCHRNSRNANVGEGFSRLGNDSLEGVKGSTDLETSWAESDQHKDGTELMSLGISGVQKA
jgi:hypothetical protein